MSIQAIGADNQILDSEVPVRQMLEQIVAKLGVPPFLLGLSWSSTERMSSQQADMLTSELDAYRRVLTPVIRKICRTWLTLAGYGPECAIQWEEITMQDEVDHANARYLTGPGPGSWSKRRRSYERGLGKTGAFRPEMGKINRYTRRAYTPEEVYAFSLVLCDNEVDRDWERFSLEALEGLRELFPGKDAAI